MSRSVARSMRGPSFPDAPAPPIDATVRVVATAAVFVRIYHCADMAEWQRGGMDNSQIRFVERSGRPRPKKRGLEFTPNHALLIIVLVLIAAAAAFSIWYDR